MLIRILIVLESTLKCTVNGGHTLMTDDAVLDRLKHVQLSILHSISNLCEDYDIKWWLDGGTCLGAMRHKGFIPWDDDIDIGMMRSDYDRFCSIASTELPDGYSFHDSRNSSGYAAMFCKVYKDGTRFENQEGRDSGSTMGIFVDVFPYDYLYDVLTFIILGILLVLIEASLALSKKLVARHYISSRERLIGIPLSISVSSIALYLIAALARSARNA